MSEEHKNTSTIGILSDWVWVTVEVGNDRSSIDDEPYESMVTTKGAAWFGWWKTILDEVKSRVEASWTNIWPKDETANVGPVARVSFGDS